MKTAVLPIEKNPAWIHMGQYESFDDALAAIRYYEVRHAKWCAIRAHIQQRIGSVFRGMI